MITLSPPQMGGVFEPGDIAGNLHEDWEIPMSESGRSSLIRREMNTAGATMGTDANGWDARFRHIAYHGTGQFLW